MGKVQNWLDDDVARQMRKEIGAANGNEVFFCGILEGGLLREVRVLARGNRDRVPALVRPEPGKSLLVIHNHPSGDLTPSGADITVASRLAREGIGFAIVNNPVSECYVVVEPAEALTTVPVAAEQIEAVLAPGGYVDQAMENFESRSQQLAMAVSLAEALNNGEHVLAEAGTGTGKSLAYLVPILLWVQKNKGRAVISTNTINLQEQLLYKDIPLLQRALPWSFKAVLVKGRGNYLCRRKFRELLRQGEGLVEENDLPSLQAMTAWEKQTRDGTKSDLGFNPGNDLWELVASDADVCLRVNCPYFRECFFQNARREAIDAQLLIVNHSLLFADIALRSRSADTGVLPEYHCLVFDEAHNIEKVATAWLGARITRLSFSRLLVRLWNPRPNKVKGLLAVIEQKLVASPDLHSDLVGGLLETLRHQLVPEILSLNEECGDFFAGVSNYLAKIGSEKERLQEGFVSQPGWQALADKARLVLSQTSEVANLLESFHKRLENLGPLGFELVLAQALELAALQARLSALETDLTEILFGDSSTLVRWVELAASRTGPRAVFNYAPLSVNKILREQVWEKYSTIVFTSATLTVDNSFAYIRDRLGLDLDLKIQERQFPSPFDYRRQVLLGIAADMPTPQERSFAEKCAQAVLLSLASSRGRALVLFTSFSLLRATATAIRPELEALGIPLLCQGELTRHQLLDKFRADTCSVLLATASFWEGVDVAGESLSNVILTRLPFTVPDHPVVQARMEALRRRGKDPFYNFQVPQAVLRFKQGFGRLIRNQRDKGVVLVLDKRIATKSYGRLFLQALPPCPVKNDTLKNILAWQGDFLSF